MTENQNQHQLFIDKFHNCVSFVSEATDFVSVDGKRKALNRLSSLVEINSHSTFQADSSETMSSFACSTLLFPGENHVSVGYCDSKIRLTIDFEDKDLVPREDLVGRDVVFFCSAKDRETLEIFKNLVFSPIATRDVNTQYPMVGTLPPVSFCNSSWATEYLGRMQSPYNERFLRIKITDQMFDSSESKKLVIEIEVPENPKEIAKKLNGAVHKNYFPVWNLVPAAIEGTVNNGILQIDINPYFNAKDILVVECWDRETGDHWADRKHAKTAEDLAVFDVEFEDSFRLKFDSSVDGVEIACRFFLVLPISDLNPGDILTSNSDGDVLLLIKSRGKSGTSIEFESFAAMHGCPSIEVLRQRIVEMMPNQFKRMTGSLCTKNMEHLIKIDAPKLIQVGSDYELVTEVTIFVEEYLPAENTQLLLEGFSYQVERYLPYGFPRLQFKLEPTSKTEEAEYAY